MGIRMEMSVARRGGMNDYMEDVVLGGERGWGMSLGFCIII